MDSRQIYKAASHLSSLVKWQDWIHFGTENEIKYDLIIKLINDFLSDNEIIFVYERTNSGYYKKDEIIETIKPHLGRDNFQLWNESMNKVIGFNRIGVLHFGEKTIVVQDTNT